MKLIVCAIADVQMKAFARPFFVPTLGIAIRGFSDEVQRADSEMGKHPTDYSLHELGCFDEETGQFENLVAPRLVIEAVDVVG